MLAEQRDPSKRAANFVMYVMFISTYLCIFFEESRERLPANTPINSFKINGSVTEKYTHLPSPRKSLEIFMRDSERGNASDPLFMAAANLTQDGRYGSELLAYRRLVKAMAVWAARAPAEPVVLLTSQRAVVTPGGASVLVSMRRL